MYIYSKCLSFILKGIRLYTLSGLIISGIVGIFPIMAPNPHQVEADSEIFLSQNLVLADFTTIQSNSLGPILNPSEPQFKVIRKINVIVTGYSSSTWETDNSPYITAAGTQVRDGIVASNLLSFGTKIQLPDIYGNKIFVVEDRMNSKKGVYQVDIWFSSREAALNFGAQLTKMEVIEEM